MKNSLFQEKTSSKLLIFNRQLTLLPILCTTLISLGSLTACNHLPQKADTPQILFDQKGAREELDYIIEQHTQGFVYQQPVLATMLDISPDKAGGAYNHRLPDYSPEGMQKLQSHMRQASSELAAIPLSQLNNTNALHIRIVKTIENYYAGSQTFPAGYIDTWGGHLPYIVNQISGPLIDVPKAMQVQQKISNHNEALQYLKRLSQLKLMTEQVLKKVKADEQQGVILPEKLFPQTLAYLNKFLSTPASKHPLVTTFAERLENIESLKAQQRHSLLEKSAAIVAGEVYPAYQKVFDFMQAQRSRAPKADGIWAQPGGGEFYQHEIQYLGDSSLTADQIHQIGLDEVDRITREMDSILSENGYNEGTVGARMVKLSSNQRFLYENSDQGREQLLNDLNQQVAAIMVKAPDIFATIPETGVEVRRIPPVSEAGEAGGFYTPPSLDGSRPGIYWINLRDMKATPSFGLKTLTYHEAVPGHHFQIALNMAQKDIGLLRQNAPFNAYVEGWALYAELLAEELGMYENDPWGNLGRLQAELYRAVRLVVDTGLHAKRWSREKAIDYFHSTTGTSMTDVVAEVERYMAWPGQALGYKLGMIEFVQLRDWARKKLGRKFDLKEFHDVILLPGARPMQLVKSDIQSWVSLKKKK